MNSRKNKLNNKIS